VPGGGTLEPELHVARDDEKLGDSAVVWAFLGRVAQRVVVQTRFFEEESDICQWGESNLTGDDLDWTDADGGQSGWDKFPIDDGCGGESSPDDVRTSSPHSQPGVVQDGSGEPGDASNDSYGQSEPYWPCGRYELYETMRWNKSKQMTGVDLSGSRSWWAVRCYGRRCSGLGPLLLLGGFPPSEGVASIGRRWSTARCDDYCGDDGERAQLQRVRDPDCLDAMIQEQWKSPSWSEDNLVVSQVRLTGPALSVASGDGNNSVTSRFFG
jgi:hypothetical protein